MPSLSTNSPSWAIILAWLALWSWNTSQSPFSLSAGARTAPGGMMMMAAEAQIPGGLPPCVATCAGSASETVGCQGVDPICICSSNSFPNVFLSCMDTGCTPPEITKGQAFFGNLCNSIVSPPPTSLPSTGSSSTPPGTVSTTPSSTTTTTSTVTSGTTFTSTSTFTTTSPISTTTTQTRTQTTTTTTGHTTTVSSTSTLTTTASSPPASSAPTSTTTPPQASSSPTPTSPSTPSQASPPPPQSRPQSQSTTSITVPGSTSTSTTTGSGAQFTTILPSTTLPLGSGVTVAPLPGASVTGNIASGAVGLGRKGSMMGVVVGLLVAVVMNV